MNAIFEILPIVKIFKYFLKIERCVNRFFIHEAGYITLEDRCEEVFLTASQKDK